MCHNKSLLEMVAQDYVVIQLFQHFEKKHGAKANRTELNFR